MPGWLSALAGLVCCGGCAFALLKARQPAEYEMVSTKQSSDFAEDFLDVDESDESNDDEPAAQPPAARSEDLVDSADFLDFSRPAAAPVMTPGVERTTRASWEAEMNAELAEFDALTEGASPEVRTSAGNQGQWKQSLEQELAKHLR
ncbi:hypothetical protein AB1Y20_004802 [Prymnesium parvum]|uniref:Clathrin light chain n=1 Tax=Prymnesium parvum TaxID=97485 RepID=A0AB34IZW6_PRYPA